MSFLVEILAEIALQIILWVILWPVVMILSTPFLIVRALFLKGSFSDNVIEGYARIHAIWSRVV